MGYFIEDGSVYFAVSDVHSCLSALEDALSLAGFDANNGKHKLIVCGDVFDRGYETLELYDFLMSLNQDRVTFIRGNHEALFTAMLGKDFPDQHDFSNGTVRTFCAIAGIDEKEMDPSYWYINQLFMLDSKTSDADGGEAKKSALDVWRAVKKAVAGSEIANWITNGRWLNYLEIGDYVFVHNFVPTSLRKSYAGLAELLMYSLDASAFEYRPDWRSATDFEWEDAAWGNCAKQFYLGQFKPETDKGKKLVCGHIHANNVRRMLGELKSKDEEDDSAFDRDGLIVLDGNTANSGVVNVLVLENGSHRLITTQLSEAERNRKAGS
jgi:hypothetical protein